MQSVEAYLESVAPDDREVVSGSGRSAQKIGKISVFLANFWTPIWRENRDFVQKMWSFPHPETAIPLEEPANPRGSRSYRRIVDSGWEKCHIFWKKTQIIFEFDSFFGVETGTFFAEKSAQILRTFDFSS